MANTSGWFEPTTDKARHEAEDCGRLVEIVRAEEGWDRTRLATAAGITETEVADFESGRIGPGRADAVDPPARNGPHHLTSWR